MKLLSGQGLCGFAMLSVLASASAVQASNITFFQFSGDSVLPNAVDPKEFIYNPSTGLTAGPGAISNGTLFAPGLFGIITGGLEGITQSPPGLGTAPGPYNYLADLSLSLTGFAPSGTATASPTFITQGLGQGDFSVYYGELVILAGHAESSLITLKDTGSNSSILSANVHYTGGVLLDQFAAAGLSDVGTFSIALSGVNGTYGIGANNLLLPFSADGIATFDAELGRPQGGQPVPTPAAIWSGLGLLTLLGVSRFKNRPTNPS